MKVSMKWLNDFVKVDDIDIKEFCKRMTLTGTKVESVLIEGEDIDKVVVGKIISIKNHENADKLVVCNVLIGEDKTVQIVTGANNIKEGDKVPVCLDGGTLPNNIKIKEGNLRGVKSQGMMCSISELGLSKDDYKNAAQDGIFILENESKVGQDIRKTLGLCDTIVDFEITSNRPDCLSIRGIAREVSATFDRPFKEENIKIDGIDENIDNLLKVKIESKKCRRYIARVVKDVEIKPSERFIRERLIKCGVRPVNNIVDITNYVMLEYGQPMHAFDYDKIRGHQIIIKDAKQGEVLETLDGTKCTLNDNDLVVCDKDGALAIAGVMGGKDSGVSDSTNKIVFESASFEGISVRKTAKKFSIRTESSIRFEKDLNEKLSQEAIERACELIEKLNIGKVIKDKIDIKNIESKAKPLLLNEENINKLLGTDIKKDEMIEILKKLNFKVEGDMVTPPIQRIDIECEADLAEEVGRIYGYDKIPSTLYKGSTTGGLSKYQKFEKKLKEILYSLNFNEVSTYSFISPNNFDKLKLDDKNPLRDAVKLKNPLGEETSVMRTTMIPSMLDVLSKNYNNKNEEARLFEIGKVYLENEGHLLKKENKVLVLGGYEKCDFFIIKGVLTTILDELKIFKYQIEQTLSMPYHKYRNMSVVINNEEIARLGQIDVRVANDYKINKEVYIIEIEVEKLYKQYKDEIKYKPLPKYPSIVRDLSLVCDKDLFVVNIEKAIKRGGGEMLREITFFDLYEGEQIEQNKKSVSYKLKFMSNERTLTDNEVDKAIEKILDECKKINVTIRE